MEDAAGQEAGIDGPSWVYCCVIPFPSIRFFQLLQPLLLLQTLQLLLLLLETSLYDAASTLIPIGYYVCTIFLCQH